MVRTATAAGAVGLSNRLATGADPAIGRALDALRTGCPVIVVDGKDRENEGDLIFAAELATPAVMAFMVRHTSGFVCVALPEEDCDRLDLPPMYGASTDRYGTRYCVTADATGSGMTTGISAADRARTARFLADPASRPHDFTRPGHVVPLRARPGGVFTRAGHTEAAVDLMALAGLRPAGVLSEIVSTLQPRRMAQRAELRAFATEHGLEMVSIEQLANHRRRTEPRVVREARAGIPGPIGQFRAVGYRGKIDGTEHLALVCGDVDGAGDVPVHVHPECLLSELGSASCDCRTRLDDALTAITQHGRGVIACVRRPTSRPPSSTGEIVADIIADLGVVTVCLLPAATHAADPRTALQAQGLLVPGDAVV